jgi:hypothetical protein
MSEYDKSAIIKTYFTTKGFTELFQKYFEIDDLSSFVFLVNIYLSIILDENFRMRL